MQPHAANEHMVDNKVPKVTRIYACSTRACANRTGAAARETLRQDRPEGSRRLHSTLKTAPVVFAQALATAAKANSFTTPSCT